MPKAPRKCSLKRAAAAWVGLDAHMPFGALNGACTGKPLSNEDIEAFQSNMREAADNYFDDERGTDVNGK